MKKGIKNIVQSKPSACRSHYSYNHLIAVCILVNRPRTEMSYIVTTSTNRKHKVSTSVHKRQRAAHRNVELFNWGYGCGDGDQPRPRLPNSRGAGALWWSAVHMFLEHLELSRGVKKSTGRWGCLGGFGDILGAENVLHSSQQSGRSPCTSQLC